MWRMSLYNMHIRDTGVLPFFVQFSSEVLFQGSHINKISPARHKSATVLNSDLRQSGTEHNEYTI